MENPASWNDAVRAIAIAISEYEKTIGKRMCGASLPQRIYNKLIAEGFTITKKRIKALK